MQTEELTFEPKPSIILGIPIEKVHKYNMIIERLYACNNLIPVLPNNQIYSQGYFNELQAFVDAVEGNHNYSITDLDSAKTVYETVEELRAYNT
jgi:virulence factor